MSNSESQKGIGDARRESTTLANSVKRRSGALDGITNLLSLIKRPPRFERVSIATRAEAAWKECLASDGTLEIQDDQELFVDREWIDLAFIELFRKAIEHSRRPPSVRIRVETDSLYVEDDGPGLPYENPRRALEAGISTKRDGGGYGLTVVKHVCAAHDWTIDLCDENRGGLSVELSHGRP